MNCEKQLDYSRSSSSSTCVQNAKSTVMSFFLVLILFLFLFGFFKITNWSKYFYFSPPRPMTNMNDTMVTHMSSGAPTPTKRYACFAILVVCFCER